MRHSRRRERAHPLLWAVLLLVLWGESLANWIVDTLIIR